MLFEEENTEAQRTKVSCERLGSKKNLDPHLKYFDSEEKSCLRRLRLTPREGK